MPFGKKQKPGCGTVPAKAASRRLGEPRNSVEVRETLDDEAAEAAAAAFYARFAGEGRTGLVGPIRPNPPDWFTDSLEHIKTAHKERSEQLHAVEKAKHALEAAKREAKAKQEAREMHQMACRMLMDHIQTPRMLDDDGNEWVEPPTPTPPPTPTESVVEEFYTEFKPAPRRVFACPCGRFRGNAREVLVHQAARNPCGENELVLLPPRPRAPERSFTDRARDVAADFAAADADGDGELSREEFIAAAHDKGIRDDEAEAMFNKLDVDGDGGIQMDEAPKEVFKEPELPPKRGPGERTTTEGHPVANLHPYYGHTKEDVVIEPVKAVRKTYPCEMPGCKFVGRTYRELAIHLHTDQVHNVTGGTLPSWKRKSAANWASSWARPGKRANE